MRTLILATALLVAATASAQNAPGTANPPGNTLAPETSAPPAAQPPVVVPAGLTPAQAAALKYRNEVVCRTSVETGSLIARHKTCMTRKQWDYTNDENERFARRVVQQGDTHTGGN